jgi:hypothetical protein
MPVDPSKPWDHSDAEIAAATAGVIADEMSETYASAIAQTTREVNAASRNALKEWQKLAADTHSNPIGIEEDFRELPGSLRTETTGRLEGLDQTLQALEDHHVRAILRHDSRDDANLRWMVDQHLAAVTPDEAGARLVDLAGDVSFSSFLAGPAGRALSARFRLKGGPTTFQRVALQTLAVDGNERQRAHAQALAKLDALKQAVGLARGGADFALGEVQKRPERRPSGVL